MKYGYLFNVNIKILIFQASWYKNKIVFRVNPKSTLFQRWILSINQRWQIDVESTWISCWPTSRRYFNIYKRWINAECLLGCLTSVKRYFEGHQLSEFFFMAQVTQILLFSGMLLLERSRITVSERHLLNKKFCYGSFEFVSNFCKKVFWGAPVKWVFLYGSSNSDSVIFGNDAFGEIKDHSLRATPFQKKCLLWKFWVCVCLT